LLFRQQAIKAHESHVDMYGGETDFDQLMEVLYAVAVGQYNDNGLDDSDGDGDYYDDDDFEGDPDAGAEDDNDDTGQAAGEDNEDEKPVHVKKTRRASLIAAQEIIEQSESLAVSEPITKTTHRRLSLTSADMADCI
jgi:hypothetical protein